MAGPYQAVPNDLRGTAFQLVPGSIDMAGSRNALFWTPRLLALWFVIFISMFAADVLREDIDWLSMAIAGAIHLLPAAAVLALLALAWRFEALGGSLFVAVGVLYVVYFWGRFGWITYLTIAGPPILIGLMFLAHSARHPERA